MEGLYHIDMNRAASFLTKENANVRCYIVSTQFHIDYAIKMKKTWSISQKFTIHFFHMGYAVILQTFCDKMGLFIIS